jgi:hypothetical protein
MAEETQGGAKVEHKESRQGHGGGGKNHGMPLGEATPELRKQWKEDLEKSGKYTPGASIKELIAKRDKTDSSKAPESE